MAKVRVRLKRMKGCTFRMQMESRTIKFYEKVNVSRRKCAFVRHFLESDDRMRLQSTTSPMKKNLAEIEFPPLNTHVMARRGTNFRVNGASLITIYAMLRFLVCGVSEVVDISAVSTVFSSGITRKALWENDS